MDHLKRKRLSSNGIHFQVRKCSFQGGYCDLWNVTIEQFFCRIFFRLPGWCLAPGRFLSMTPHVPTPWNVGKKSTDEKVKRGKIHVYNHLGEDMLGYVTVVPRRASKISKTLSLIHTFGPSAPHLTDYCVQSRFCRNALPDQTTVRVFFCALNEQNLPGKKSRCFASRNLQQKSHNFSKNQVPSSMLQRMCCCWTCKG